MTWRSVIVYWVAAALIGGFVYAGFRRDEVAPPPPATVPPLVSVSPSRFDEVTVRRGNRTLSIARKDDRWVLVSPPELRLTSDLVAALLDTLATIPPVEKLSADGRAGGPFGLSPPEVEVSMKGGDGVTATVDIGKRNPTGTAVYAAIAGEGSVYLLGLNAQYYVELIFDEIDRQRTGAPPAE
jgi:hypothetical protein